MFKQLIQARNQEFSRAKEFSWNQGTSINKNEKRNSSAPQGESKAPQGKISGFFPWKRLTFSPVDGNNQAIFSPNQGNFFQFPKIERSRPSLPPFSYAPVITVRISLFCVVGNLSDEIHSIPDGRFHCIICDKTSKCDHS